MPSPLSIQIKTSVTASEAANRNIQLFISFKYSNEHRIPPTG